MPDEPHEFGKRRPAEPESTGPVKRSRHVALLLMGSFAVGGSALALMQNQNCRPATAPPSGQTDNGCGSHGYSSGGGHGVWGGSSRSNFFGGDSASSSTASEAEGITRGGFGSFARGFMAHFSGGG